MSNEISRASLPAEFFDVTSVDLLKTPEPDYFHAKLLLMTLRFKVDFSSQWGLPIPGRQIPNSGSPYADFDKLIQQISPDPDPVYSTAIRMIAELGKKGMGHTVRINRPKFTDSVATKAARRVPTGTAISKTPIPILSEQAQVTIERFAGPYSDSASEVRPFGIERFDANRMVHDPASIKDLHLTRDFHRVINTINRALFDQADPSASTGIVYPDGMTSNDTPAAPGVSTFPFGFAVIKKTVRRMKERKVPRFANGKYMMVISPKQREQLDTDPQWQRISRYDEKINPALAANYVGSLSEVDVFESTELNVVANSNSVDINYGQCFGPEGVGWGVDDMPRVAPDSDDNYGETAKVIWLWYAGCDVLDSRFLYSVRTD